MVEFTIHAGLHKTATTSLQEHVFPNAKHVYYTGKSRHLQAISPRMIANSVGEANEELLRMLRKPGEKPERLPLHSCCHYLSLLQDNIVSMLARGYFTIEDLRPLFMLNERFLEALESKCDHAHILYSCEGLLLARGHLMLEKRRQQTEVPPLFHHRLLFPGKLNRVVVYLRSPVDYLFSRYIQIHTVRFARMKGHPQDLVVSIDRYLDFNAQLWRGEAPHQSVFYHIFQPQLISDLRALDLPLVVRSYDKHIRGTESITAEVAKAFDLQVYQPERVDQVFREKPLNTTSDDKDSALNHLLKASGCEDRASLQRHFAEIAAAHPLIQQAMATTVFPAR